MIEKNDVIRQFRIVENQPQILFEECAHLDGKNRGDLAVPESSNHDKMYII